MKKIFDFKYGILFALIVLAFSCKQNDFTDDSTLVPSNPTVAVSGIPTTPINFTEKDSTFIFEVALSTIQTVDVKIFISQSAGDATEGKDFEILNDGSYIVIPAGSLTAKVKIQVLTDDLAESEEKFTIQVGDNQTSNAVFAPVSVDFTIQNVTTNVLKADLAWTTNVLEAVGVEEDPEKVVNMRLLITDTDNNILGSADGASFETWAGFDTLPDGTYKIATDIYSTMNFGNINAPITLSLTLEFNQLGVINNQTLTFTDAMTNEHPCGSYRTILATVTKVGSAYTIAKDLAYLIPQNATLAGEWFGLDPDDDSGYNDFESKVVVSVPCSNAIIKGLGEGWMTDFWGEVITEEMDLTFNIDWATNTVTIPNQYYMHTTYHDVVQLPYNLEGTGTIDVTGAFPKMVISYDLIQDGTSWAGWCFAEGYLSTPLFVANLTLDPDGLKKSGKTTMQVKLPIKH